MTEFAGTGTTVRDRRRSTARSATRPWQRASSASPRRRPRCPVRDARPAHRADVRPRRPDGAVRRRPESGPRWRARSPPSARPSAPTFAGTGAEGYVTGETAVNLDVRDMTDDYLPIVLAHRPRPELPAPAGRLPLDRRAARWRSCINLLSVGAAYGLLVLVFQEGVGADLLRLPAVRRDRGLAAAVPLLRPVRALAWTTTSSCSAASASTTSRPATTTRVGRASASAPSATPHHRRGADHGRRLRRLRRGRPGHVPADGLRPRGRGADRRDDRAHDARCRRP